MTCLVKLPKSFVELYSMVNRVKGRESHTEDADDDGGFETAICLLTGAVMRSGTVRRMKTVRAPDIYLIDTTAGIKVSPHPPLFLEPASRHVYITREKGRFWNRYFLSGPEVHYPSDAQ